VAGAYTGQEAIGCQNIPSAASNTQSPPQPKSNHVKKILFKILTTIATSLFLTALSAPNSFSTGAPPRTLVGELTALPQTT